MGFSSWKRLEEEKPALAEFGAARLDGKVAYLATTRSTEDLELIQLPQLLAADIFLFS